MAAKIPPAGALSFKTALVDANKTDKERQMEQDLYIQELKAQITKLEAYIERSDEEIKTLLQKCNLLEREITHLNKAAENRTINKSKALVKGDFKQDLMNQMQKVFTSLTSLATETLSSLIEHQTVDTQGRELAWLLKSRPNDLQAKLSLKETSYQDAVVTLGSLVHNAVDFISQGRKPALPEGWTTHRAKILLERLTVMK